MALVPNLGRELVLWCSRTDTAGPGGEEEGGGGVGEGGVAAVAVVAVTAGGLADAAGGGGEDCGGGGGEESSERRASTWASGTELRLPYLLLMLLRTLLLTLPLAESESESAGCGGLAGSCSSSLVVGLLLVAARSLSDLEACREEALDLSDILDDCEGERDEEVAAMSEDLELVRLSICSTLENSSELQSDPMLRRLASTESLVLLSEARADSKLPFQLNRSSSKAAISDTPELDEWVTRSNCPRGREPRRPPLPAPPPPPPPPGPSTVR